MTTKIDRKQKFRSKKKMIITRYKSMNSASIDFSFQLNKIQLCISIIKTNKIKIIT